MLRFAIKAGLAGGAVYYSRQEGIWKENTDEVYERYCKALQPHLTSVRQYLPVEVPALPSSGEVNFLTKHYYNEGVKNTIYFIHRIPCYMGQWTKQASDAVKKALNPPGEGPSSTDLTTAPKQ
ncbi:MICOS complex subunit MIC13 homolog QIL1-like [Toxorhynchites rutilus septentrionalis]|uniref:MICOS complex subunit MIC13 homolog QIL1-like n=1 Tax=Toxorhynchites rutilus septentrionalis TaxID=329112 RepID=UPI00247A0B38|nr:MICOS complex subunit MIC13 homolog QIL1-like [Toxorhynchites rutilus septentrionalis]